MRAALELFAEQGYDAATVNGIAERAGLTKTTFFRHFADKREVLFGGQEIHNRLVTDTIAAAPIEATPLQTVGSALDALTATFTDDRRALAAQLHTIIAANSELRERATSKRTGLAEAITDALGKRGVPELTASLAAELGVRAYYRAFDEWADPASEQTLTDLTRQALDELRAAAIALD